jgi:hypothetical protein
MATQIKRLETFIKETVPTDKQPDMFALLREFRHQVLHEATCAIAEQAAADRWGTEVRLQFAKHMQSVLLKDLSKKDFLACNKTKSSQTSELEL